MRSLAATSIALAILCCASAASANPAYPLKKSSNGRYFVDQGGVPVLLHGDSPWSLISELTREEVTIYLDDCVARKFNSLIVTSPDAVFTSNPPKNAYGNAPFTTPGKFSTPNEAYFQHADWVIQEAGARGIQILLAPAYLGQNGEGWLDQVRNNNTEQEMRTYGTWVGNRYKNRPNLIFHWGNDVLPANFGSVSNKIRAMAQGLRSVDSKHLMTYHSSSEQSTYGVWSVTQENWIDFNNTYTYQPVWQSTQRDYAFSPTRPFVLFESKYENEHGTSGKQQRVQAYQALLSGAAGQFYGNSPIWHMGVLGGNWQAALSDPGRLDMMHVRDLFESRAWYRLVPDTANTVLTSGQSTGDDRAMAARTNDGETLIVYAPSRRTLRINLEALSGASATAWWFNPRDGSVDRGTPLTSSGSRDFTPPTNDDWVLVIDDANSMLPAPGTEVLPPELDCSGPGGSGATAQPGVMTYQCCSASTPGRRQPTPWFVAALGALIVLLIVERRRRCA